jgi:Domain of unknown function (DUF4345)
MMRTVARVIVGVIALFNLAIGVGVVLAPAQLAAAFFVDPVGLQGLATIRADFGGFFIGAAVFALIGAWRADARLLTVPVTLLGIALAGRIVSLVADGRTPESLPPIAAEVVMLAVLLWAMRAFGARR